MTTPLRIALCCQQDLQLHPLPAYRFWVDYFRRGLAEAGHIVLECRDCDWAEGLLPRGRDEHAGWLGRTWTRYVEWMRQEHARHPVDLSLSYLYPAQIEPNGVAAIRSLGVPTVNFFCDHVREFRRLPNEFRSFDLSWVPEYKALAMYAAEGLPHLHAPMPCWVPPRFRTPVTRESESITFIGTRDEQRAALFASSIRRGLNVELRGTGWIAPGGKSPIPPSRAGNPAELLRRQWAFARQYGWTALYRRHFDRRAPCSFDFSPYALPPPQGDDYWTALRDPAVCLGVNRYPSLRLPFDAPGTYSRLRDIEAPMAGACYLTEWTEGFEELYEPGVHVEVYRTAEELVDKAQALAREPRRRALLRANGQRRALEDHSIGRSIDRIRAQLVRN